MKKRLFYLGTITNQGSVVEAVPLNNTNTPEKNLVESVISKTSSTQPLNKSCNVSASSTTQLLAGAQGASMSTVQLSEVAICCKCRKECYKLFKPDNLILNVLNSCELGVQELDLVITAKLQALTLTDEQTSSNHKRPRNRAKPSTTYIYIYI